MSETSELLKRIALERATERADFGQLPAAATWAIAYALLELVDAQRDHTRAIRERTQPASMSPQGTTWGAV